MSEFVHESESGSERSGDQYRQRNDISLSHRERENVNVFFFLSFAVCI